MTRDWSNLKNDLLRSVAGKLRTLEDFIRLGVVCRNWMNVLMKQDGSIFTRPQLPWLILPCDHEHDNLCHSQCHSRRAFSMMENKVHNFDFPEAFGKKCVGSSHGWLIMVEDVSPAIFMLNPLTKQRIELPPVTTMPEILGFNKEDVGREYIFRNILSGEMGWMSLKHVESYFTHKIILSNDPKEKDCIAVALCGKLSRLFFCRIGDSKWRQVEHDLKHSQNDVVYSKGKFYVVNCAGKIGFFDVKNPKVTIICEPPYGSITHRLNPMYLAVDTSGALFLISRWIDCFSKPKDADDDDTNFEDDKEQFYGTQKFNVFKLDEEKNEWKKVRDIGETIVFLGENQSVCYSTVEFPECQRNSIYFTDNWEMKGNCMHEGHDVGIFNIGNGLVRKLPCFNEDMPPMRILPSAVWFTPSIRSSFRTKTT